MCRIKRIGGMLVIVTEEPSRSAKTDLNIELLRCKITP